MSQIAVILAGIKIIEEIIMAIKRAGEVGQSDPAQIAAAEERIAALEARWAAVAPSPPPEAPDAE